LVISFCTEDEVCQCPNCSEVDFVVAEGVVAGGRPLDEEKASGASEDRVLTVDSQAGIALCGVVASGEKGVDDA